MPTQISDACRSLLALQRGMIGRQQALDAGVGPDTIDALLRAGRWQRIHWGVYAAFTGEPGREALRWAALVRAGPDAMLSHQSAAELYGFAGDSGGPIHVTVPRDRSYPGRIPGVVIHRVGRARDVRHPYFLPPRTGIEATVLDLAETAGTVDEAFGWLCRATGKWLTTTDRLRPALRRRTKMRWRADLLSSLDMVDDGVRSNLELRYVRDVERPHGLPRAVRQARVIRYGKPCYLDNFYEAYRACVELDGLAAHPPGERWRDFRRDNAGAVDGIITLRYGWSDVTGSPCQVASQVAAVLRQRGWKGATRRCGAACRIR